MSAAAKVVPITRGRRRPQPREGPLVELLRIAAAGRRGLSWEAVARLWSAAYFSWHSEETDDFGFDPKFAERVRPLLEFLYGIWWRVESAGVDNVPASGGALIVANHS